MALNKGNDNTAIKAEHSPTAKSCVLARDAAIADVRDNVELCLVQLLDEAKSNSGPLGSLLALAAV